MNKLLFVGQVHAIGKSLESPEILPLAKSSDGVNMLFLQIIQDDLAVLIDVAVKNDIGKFFKTNVFDNEVFRFENTHFNKFADGFFQHFSGIGKRSAVGKKIFLPVTSASARRIIGDLRLGE